MTTNKEGPGAAPAVRHEVEGPRITDALYQAFPNRPAPLVTDPQDGMPRPVVQNAMKDAEAPDLDPARFVCMADCSAFVERDDWGYVTATYSPDEVQRSPDGSWFVVREVGFAFWKRRYRLPVEPVRPQCAHYARQLVPFPEAPEHTLAVRLCTARRTDEGEFLDLGNQQILACELRDPSVGNESLAIDSHDAATIAMQRLKKSGEVADDFDLDAALGAQTTKGK